MQPDVPQTEIRGWWLNRSYCAITKQLFQTRPFEYAMRASQGGHDVPDDKLVARYPRSLANLKRAIAVLPIVIVFDNDDLSAPYRRVAEFARGKQTWVADSVPAWLAPLV